MHPVIREVIDTLACQQHYGFATYNPDYRGELEAARKRAKAEGRSIKRASFRQLMRRVVELDLLPTGCKWAGLEKLVQVIKNGIEHYDLGWPTPPDPIYTYESYSQHYKELDGYGLQFDIQEFLTHLDEIGLLTEVERVIAHYNNTPDGKRFPR
jgi:hypothetical protein